MSGSENKDLACAINKVVSEMGVAVNGEIKESVTNVYQVIGLVVKVVGAVFITVLVLLGFMLYITMYSGSKDDCTVVRDEVIVYVDKIDLSGYELTETRLLKKSGRVKKLYRKIGKDKQEYYTIITGKDKRCKSR